MNKSFIFALISSLIVLLDQYSKYFVRHKLVEGKSIKLLGNIVYLTYVRNRGAAFGVLQGGRWMFISVGLIVTILVIFNIKFVTSNDLLLVGSSLLLGGIIGNLIDRIFLGFVTDFVDFRFWPVFNIADSAVDIGLLIIIYFIFFENGKNFKSRS